MSHAIIDALGLTVAFTDATGDADLLAAVAASWEDQSIRSDGLVLAARFQLSLGPESLSQGEIQAEDPSSLLSLVSSVTTLCAIEHNRGRLLMLHASGIALPTGEVIAFIGPSGRGKTTLARELGAHWGYVSDETIAIEPTGTVHPYRKPLSIIDPARPEAPKGQFAPSALGLAPLPDAPLRLAALVLLDRSPDAPEVPTIESVPLAEGIVELVPMISYLPDLPEGLQVIARLATATGGIRRLRYRDAADVVAVVPGILDARADDPWEPAADPAAEHASPGSAAPAAASPALLRADVVDAIATESGVLALRDGTVHLLAGIAPLIWDATARPASLAEVTEHVVDVLGAPEGADPAELVSAAVDELVASGHLQHWGA